MAFVLVLNPRSSTRGALHDAMLRVLKAIRELNKLGFALEGPADEALSPSKRVLSWQNATRGTRIQLFDDRENDILYLQVEATTLGDVSAVRDVLESSLPVASLDALKREAEGSAAGFPQSLVRLAFGAPAEFDEEVARTLRHALKSPDAAVRRHAGYAIAIAMWPELLSDLEDSARVESAPENQGRMSSYVDALRKVQRPTIRA
jgi:hypothetical protein